MCWPPPGHAGAGRPDRKARRRAGTSMGMGVGGFLRAAGPLDFGNAGTGVRLAMGLVGALWLHQPFRRRRVAVGPADAAGARPLRAIGVESSATMTGRLPITLRGPRTPLPIEYRVPMASAQVKSCRAAGRASASPGITTVIEPVMTRDHTEKHARGFRRRNRHRRPRTSGERTIRLTGLPDLRGSRSWCRAIRPRRPSPSWRR